MTKKNGSKKRDRRNLRKIQQNLYDALNVSAFGEEEKQPIENNEKEVTLENEVLASATSDNTTSPIDWNALCIEEGVDCK